MIGVSRDRQREEVDSNEAEIFKKCFGCMVRPASIRCQDCFRENRPELMCYGCSRKVHSDKSHHGYEYATFKDMLLAEEERSMQETDSLAQNNLFKIETRASKPFYDASPEHTTHDNSLVSAVEFYVQPSDSPGKKQYQTFGKKSDRNQLSNAIETRQIPHQKIMFHEDKENNGVFLQGQQIQKCKGSTQKDGGTSHHHKSYGMDYKKVAYLAKDCLKPTNDRNKSQNSQCETKQYQEMANGKPKLPPRLERPILREVENRSQVDHTRNRDDLDHHNFKRDKTGKSGNGSQSIDHHGLRGEKRHTGYSHDVDTHKLSLDPNLMSTPQKTPTKGDKERRLLTGSSWKGRSKVPDSQAHMMHSPVYLDSITELHRTEIESLKTRHRVEIDRVESELFTLKKNFEYEMAALKEEHKEALEEASDFQIRNEELEKVVANLRTQNSLLKEENELLRESTSHNNEKEQELIEEIKRMHKTFELDQQTLRAKCSKDIDNVRQEYEEHFVEQISMYTENLRNKDNLLRCKDEMIHNLEKEVERLRKLLDFGMLERLGGLDEAEP